MQYHKYSVFWSLLTLVIEEETLECYKTALAAHLERLCLFF